MKTLNQIRTLALILLTFTTAGAAAAAPVPIPLSSHFNCEGQDATGNSVTVHGEFKMIRSGLGDGTFEVEYDESGTKLSGPGFFLMNEWAPNTPLQASFKSTTGLKGRVEIDHYFEQGSRESIPGVFINGENVRYSLVCKYATAREPSPPGNQEEECGCKSEDFSCIIRCSGW